MGQAEPESQAIHRAQRKCRAHPDISSDDCIPAITAHSSGRIQHVIVAENSPINQCQSDQSQIDFSVVEPFINKTSSQVREQKTNDF